jgi:hypothetical protein
VVYRLSFLFGDAQEIAACFLIIGTVPLTVLVLVNVFPDLPTNHPGRYWVDRAPAMARPMSPCPNDEHAPAVVWTHSHRPRLHDDRGGR